MRRLPMDMPIGERLAPAILRQEGFQNIHWSSLLFCHCHYDFTATKNGVKYLIEVKSRAYKVDEAKIGFLKGFNMPVLFLVVDWRKEKYRLISLEHAENRFGRRIMARPMARPPDIMRGGVDGRCTIPQKMRRGANIDGKKCWVECEAFPPNQIIMTILHRWEPNKRIKGKVKKQ